MVTKAQAIKAAELSGLTLLELDSCNKNEVELMLATGLNFDGNGENGGQHSHVVSCFKHGRKAEFWRQVAEEAAELRNAPRYICANDCDCREE